MLLEKIATYLGVRYIYKDSSQPTSQKLGERLEVVSRDGIGSASAQGLLGTWAVTVMPTEWLVPLHPTAKGCDREISNSSSKS